jgi:hypothetical protein
MKKLLALLVVPLALALCVTPGLAQMEMGGPTWVFVAHAGYALPMGDFGDFYDGAVVAGVAGGYMFTEQYGLVVGVDWNKFSANDDLMTALELLDPDAEDQTVQFIPVTTDFVATFPAGDFTPYVKGGLGMYFSSVEYTSDGHSDTSSDSDFGFNGGVGVKIPVAETTVFIVGASFHHILTEDEATQYFGVGAGVGFLF